MSEIKCSNICKTYGKKQVLDHINLTLEKGKIYGLIGRNGAGNSHYRWTTRLGEPRSAV